MPNETSPRCSVFAVTTLKRPVWPLAVGATSATWSARVIVMPCPRMLGTTRKQRSPMRNRDLRRNKSHLLKQSHGVRWHQYNAGRAYKTYASPVDTPHSKTFNCLTLP